MKFRFLKDVAIADVAFESYGKTFAESAQNAGTALAEIMTDTKKLKTTEAKTITVEGKDEKSLLYDFLEELVYIKDVEGIIFCKFEAAIKKGKMQVKCRGGKIESIGRENLRNDVKAITLHMFDVKKTKAGYTATVVADI